MTAETHYAIFAIEPEYESYSGIELSAHACGRALPSVLTMPKITALLHCHGDRQQLARALETLRPCDEVLVIKYNGNGDAEKTAREAGATVKAAVPGVSPGAYLVDAANDWILCLEETETLSDELEASLLEWKQQEHESSKSFAINLRRQQDGQWRSGGRHTRLVNRTCVNWLGELPYDDENSELLEGDLLQIEQTEQAAD